MRVFYLLILVILGFSSSATLYAQGDPQLQWVFNAVNANPLGGQAFGNSIVVDAAGSRYVTGYFQNTADFDPSAATANLTSFGNDDIFIAKYDANGNYIWAKALGGRSSDRATSIALDNSGQPHITGHFQATADFDPSAANANLTPIGNYDVFIAKYDTNGNYIWAKAIGGGSEDIAASIALDNNGQVHITGYFQGTADFDPSAATSNLTSGGSEDIFIAKYDVNGNYLWAKAIGGISADKATCITLNSTGQLHITGYFWTVADFDPSAATANLTSVGTEDIFIAKYDANGNYIWAKAVGGASQDRANSIALNNSGEIHITGHFTDPADFDPSAATNTLTSSGSEDIFIAKYDANGNYIWSKAMGGSSADIGNSIALDSSGQVVVTGCFQATADFDPSAVNVSYTSQGGYDIFIAKYDSNGNYLWAKALGASNDNLAYSIALDSSDQVHITGYFWGVADFDPSAAAFNLTSGPGVPNCFIAAYSNNGSYLNAGRIGGYSGSTGTNEAGNAIVTDGNGNVYVTGFFYGTADFDPSAGAANLTSVGNSDIFIAKYNVNGNYLWAKAIGGLGDDFANTVALDNSGQVHINGYFIGTSDFDPSAATANFTSAGGYDVFFAKYDTNGNYLWANTVGGISDDIATGIKVDASGQVHISGRFQGTADFNPSAAITNLTSVGGYDMFIAKYDSNGNYLWAKAMGGPSSDLPNALAIDNSGQVHLTGGYLGTVDFNPAAATANLTSMGGYDMFVAKYDSNGNYLWAKGVGSTGSEVAQSIALNDTGQAYITGYFTGTVDFNPGPATDNVSAVGSNDIFIAKYDANGNFFWVKSIGGTGSDLPTSITVDASGQPHVTGRFFSTADFDPSAGTANLSSVGSDDIFIAKYDTGGNYVWAKAMGGSGGDIANSIAINSSGAVHITGSFQNIADFDPSPAMTALTSVNSSDLFVAKYSDCIASDTATINSSALSVCSGTPTTFSIASGNLNSATQWQWYAGTCGGSPVGTGTSIVVTPTVTTTYYVRGEGGCVTPGTCASITITVEDTVAPVVPVLSDVTAQCAATPTMPTANDACAGTITGTTATAFPITTQGTTVVTWTFNDGNGNTSTTTQNVIIDDTTAPVAPTVTDVTEQCSATPTAPTANDACAGTITGTTATVFPITTQGTTVVTWTFNDGNGNTSTTTQNVIIDDTTAPIAPTLTDITAQCSATPTAPTANDACVGTITGTTTTVFPITTQGTTVVTWTFNDGNGNTSTAMQNVIIDDTVAPVVPVLSDVTAQCAATPTMPTANDACAGTITGTTSTAFPITTQGTTVVTWTFNDGNGNTSTTTQNVIIDDTTAPVAPTVTDVTAQCSATPTAPTANDACAGTITGTTATVFPITTQGTTVVTWTFNDGNGNTSTAMQNVIIDDTVAPVAPTLTDVTGQCSATPTAPTANDACAGTITGTTTTVFPITTQGTTVVTWTFNDGNGNTSTAMQNVIIDDTVPPVAPTLTDVTGQCSATPTAPIANDACAGIITGTTVTAFPITAQGTTVVTWTFNDGNGNTSTATQNIILNNTTDTTVTLSGTTLTAVTVADSYQWIDCNNGNAIVPLAINQSFTPAVSGNYAVILTVNGCDSTSACQTVLDVKENDFGVIGLYPNPTTGNFVIKLPYAMDAVEVVVNDMLGKTIKRIVFNQQEELQLSLDSSAAGVYFVKVQSDQKTKTFKVIKKD